MGGNRLPAHQKPFQPVVGAQFGFERGNVVNEESAEDQNAEERDEEDRGGCSSATLPTDVDFYEKIVPCEKSVLQSELGEELENLVVIMRKENLNGLRKLLCNHPFLLYEKVIDLASNVKSQRSKQTRKEWNCFSQVLNKFPTGYEMGVYRMEESGKFKKIVQMIQTATEQRIIVVSNYNKSLNLLAEFIAPLNLDYSIHRVDVDTVPRGQLRTIELGQGRVLVLLNAKSDRLDLDLFSGARLVFFDFDQKENGATFRMWSQADVRIVQQLVTKGTFEVSDVALD